MEHDHFQPTAQDVQDHDGLAPGMGDLSDDMVVDQSMQALHLPPGLDLLFQMLDEMSDGFTPPSTEKMTPTPYFRTPSLGS
jgi:hypothetical protein